MLFSHDIVAADLGYGDIRPLPGALAWIEQLRRHGKRIGAFARDAGVVGRGCRRGGVFAYAVCLLDVGRWRRSLTGVSHWFWLLFVAL